MKKIFLLALILLLFTLSHQNINASRDCYCLDNYGNQIPINPYCPPICTSYIDSYKLVQIEQISNEWCWAACIQMIFSYYGHSITQPRIVQETFGLIENWPAQHAQILSALNRDWTDDDGTTFTVSSTSYGINLLTIAQNLIDDEPLIVGTLGHAMVLTALTYFDRGNIISATVRDRWPFNDNRRILTPAEWHNIMFIARIKVD